MIKKKLNNFYSVKTNDSAIKDVDANSRIATGIFNTFYYVDKDDDVLVSGCSKKSINDRGPMSKAFAKIKHLKDHDFALNTAKILVLEEKEIEYEGKRIKGIYHESYYPNTTLGNDMFINVSEGIYDNRSIGFRYKNIELAAKDPEKHYGADITKKQKEKALSNWNKVFPMLINPKDVRNEMFFVVKEIELYEGSDVSFGANSLTPLLGLKSDNKDSILKKLQEKQDKLIHTVKTGYQSDLCLKELEIQMLQIKQLQQDLTEVLPSNKDILLNSESSEIDTNSVNAIDIIKNLKI